MTAFKLSRRSFVGAGLGTLGLAALSPRLLAQDRKDVALQLSWLHSVQFGGSYIAKSKGYWSQAGLQVALNPGGPNAPVDPAVVTGQALIGISAADYASASVEQGAPFKIIGVAMQKNPFVIASLPEKPGQYAGRSRGQEDRHGARQYAGPAGALHHQQCRHQPDRDRADTV